MATMITLYTLPVRATWVRGRMKGVVMGLMLYLKVEEREGKP